MKKAPTTAEEWIYFNDPEFDTSAGCNDFFALARAESIDAIPGLDSRNVTPAQVEELMNSGREKLWKL
ncbi:hypothetical protein KKA95_05225 [Patescibacteria group bacterium]|nr:hypothetical protein [Patescibacteria group bacterium]